MNEKDRGAQSPVLCCLMELHSEYIFVYVCRSFDSNSRSELMQLKECAYSLMMDYDSPTFQDVLVSRGSDKGDIAVSIYY